MKLVIELNTISHGGGERVLDKLVRSFHEYGHEIIIFSWNPEWKAYTGFPFPVEVHILKKIPYWGKGFSSTIEYYRVLKEVRPDAIIAFLSTSLRVSLICAKLLRIPIITSLRINGVFTTIIEKLEKCLLMSCDGIVFQTKEVQGRFPKKIIRKSVVIHNMLMDDNLPIVESCNKKKEIVGIGRLSEEKNFKLLIDAFSEINSGDYILKIFGEGPLRKNLEKQIISQHLEDKVFLMGKVDKVVDYIKDSEIFVLSSNSEGMPNALMESMAMGLACIATDVSTGGTRALIENQRNGILVPVGDKESMKKALCLLIKDDCLRMKISNEAIKIRNLYSKEIIIPQWLDYIRARVQSSYSS